MNPPKLVDRKYVIGDKSFKTKKSENYVRETIDSLGCCKIDNTHPNYSFFVGLLNNHPKCGEKIGNGIDSFYIKHNAMNRKSYETVVKRNDGTEDVFSWVQCCRFKGKTMNEYLMDAMRTAVSDSIIKYKKEHKLVCSLCGDENESVGNYHVDHDNPSFRTLRDNFMSITKTKVPSMFTECPVRHLTVFHRNDDDFRREWTDYHNANCNLQILCKKCNLHKR